LPTRGELVSDRLGGIVLIGRLPSNPMAIFLPIHASA
jgi:hypothetical protein